MEAFREAHKILVVTYPGDEKTIYPYRMAEKYVPFYEKFFKKMTPKEKSEFLAKCSEMKTKCTYFIQHSDGVHRLNDVKNTEKKLQKILNENSFVELNKGFKYSKLK